MTLASNRTATDVELEALIGTGSVGEVWRARLPDGTVVALKRMLPHAARQASSVAAFEREARLHERLRTDGIPRFHEYGQDDLGPFLLLEYVEGTTLSELAGEPIAPRLALRVARDVLLVLESVHAMTDDEGRKLGLVHRDLSAANVLIGVRGCVKLADFGIARAAVGTHATTGVLAKGTLGYMSPEQARGEPLDARSDLFSVGALLHEMLSGAALYDEQDARLALARARAGDVEPFAQSLPNGDPALCDLVDQALSAEPVERFPSAKHMRLEVERIAERVGMATDEEVGAWARTKPRDEQPVQRPTSPSPAEKTDGVFRQTWWLGAALLFVSVVSLLVWSPWTSRSAPDGPATMTSTMSSAPPPHAPPTSSSSIAPAASSSPATAPSSVPLPMPTRSVAPSPPPRSSATPAAPATLDIGSSPSFAYVSIDGRELGATPLFGVKLAPGTHTITVRRDGIGARTVTIDLQPGERARKVISLP